jgi:hypothetical protein
MAAAGESSTSLPAAKEKPIIVRVKRKPSQPRPDAFCELLFRLLCSIPFQPSTFNFYFETKN